MKATFVAPILLTNEAGDRIFDQMIVVLPEEANPLPAEAVACEKPPVVLTRQNFACLLRQWRQDPATPPEDRNYPTASQIALMIVRRAVRAETLNLVEL